MYIYGVHEHITLNRFMNKTLTLSLIALLGGVIVTSCSKSPISPEISPKGEDAIRFSTTPTTKTYFGTLSGGFVPTLWNGDESVGVSLNMAAFVMSSNMTTSDDGLSATFSAAVSDDNSGSYTFYAISPIRAVVDATTDKFTGSKRKGIDIPSTQTPLDSSVDESAQILVAKTTTAEFPSSVSLSFSHLLAYVKLSFSNLSLSEGESVTSIALTSPEYWAGRYYYYFADNGSYSEGQLVKRTSGSKTSVKTITLITSKTRDIWFACAPVDLSGKELEIVIATDTGNTYSKTVTIPDGHPFEKGVVSSFTVNMLTSSVSSSTIEKAELTELMISKAADYRSASMKTGYRNGVYVYSTSLESYTDNPAKLAARIAVLGFKDVYLSPGKSRITDTSEDLKSFISSCTALGLKVYAVRLNDVTALSDESVVDSEVSLITTYNASVDSDERFVGIAADLEPQAAKSSNPSGVTDSDGNPIYWSSGGYSVDGSNDILLGYTIERLKYASSIMSSNSLVLSEAVFPRYQREINDGNLSKGSTADFLASCSFLITMAYYSTVSSIWKNADYVLAAAGSAGKSKSVSVCIKTSHNNGDDGTTLYYKGWSNLITAVQYLISQGQSESSFRGIDMFTYEAIEAMWTWTEDNESSDE